MRGAPSVYTDFSGGVNLEADPYLLETNEARDAINVRTQANGQLRKRNGFVLFEALGEPSSTPVDSLGAADISEPVLLASVGTSLFSITSGGVSTDITPAASPAEGGWSFAQAPESSGAKGPVYAMNGVDDPLEWSGSGDFVVWTADTGTLPNGRFLMYHAGRLWCVPTAAPSRVQYSGFDGTSPDMGAWDANDYVDFEPDDGEEITGLGTLGDYILVFKPRKIYVIYDTITGANRQLIANAGCCSHRSIVETALGTFFLDELNGVMLTDGNRVEKVSTKIDPLLRTATTFPSQIKFAAATFYDSRYYLSVSVGGEANDRILEYDTANGSWWIHDCFSNQFALLDPLGEPKLYSASPEGGVDEAFVRGEFEDRGEVYANGAYWVGPWRVWGAPHVQKRVRQVRVDGAGQWVLAYATNFNEAFTEDQGELWDISGPQDQLFAPSSDDGHVFAPSAPTGDMFAPATVAVSDRRYYTLGVARAWSFRLSNDDPNDFQIYAKTVATGSRTD